MRLRARLAMLVVLGLLLIVAGAVYTEMLPWQAQGQAVGVEQRGGSDSSSPQEFACPISGDCSNRDSAGNCAIGGCGAAKAVEQSQAHQQEAEPQPQKVAAGEETAEQSTEKSRAEAAE